MVISLVQYMCQEKWQDAYRRQGLAKEICNYLIDKARNKGADKIYLESSDKAVGLYKSLGFANMNGYMKLNKIK